MAERESQFIFVTRSGTNQLHGTAYDYLRNNFFDANNWFNDYLGQPEAPLRQNDFGGTFGAPVTIPRVYNGRNKTFVFISYEGLRLVQPQAATLESVPDSNLRANSAAPIAPILNAFPLSNLGVEETLPCSGTTYSNAAPYPCPSGAAAGTPVASGLAEYARSYSSPSTINAFSAMLDDNITSKMTAFFRT